MQRFLGLLLQCLCLKQGILLSAFKDFWRGHKLHRFYPKQGTFLRLLSSTFGGIPLPPPLRRRCLWMAPKVNCTYGVQKQKIQKPEFLVNLRLSGAHEPMVS